MRTAGGEPVDGQKIIAKLIETFGVQIFSLGKFHSDPHPGNLLVAPDGKTLSIIDFGQTKAGVAGSVSRSNHTPLRVSRSNHTPLRVLSLDSSETVSSLSPPMYDPGLSIHTRFRST